MDTIVWSLPAWAVTPECQAFVYGFGVGTVVRLFRVALKMIKHLDSDSDRNGPE